MFSDLRYSTTFLATPPESRKAWTSKARFCVDFLLELMLPELTITRMMLAFHRKPIIYHEAQRKINAWRVVAQFESAAPRGWCSKMSRTTSSCRRGGFDI